MPSSYIVFERGGQQHQYDFKDISCCIYFKESCKLKIIIGDHVVDICDISKYGFRNIVVRHFDVHINRMDKMLSVNITKLLLGGTALIQSCVVGDEHSIVVVPYNKIIDCVYKNEEFITYTSHLDFEIPIGSVSETAVKRFIRDIKRQRGSLLDKLNCPPLC